MGDQIKAENLLEVLDLKEKYPQKITQRDAVCMRSETLGLAKCSDPKKLYLQVLQMIMSCNRECRSSLLSPDATLTSNATNSTPVDDFSGEDNVEDSQFKVSPVDVLLALIHCADDFLRQDLMARLVTCQLSIPLILPNPITGELTLLLWALRTIVKEWKNSKSEVHECPIVSYATPMIAFVRFSQQDKSKSKIMNEVISDSHNDYFFHRDCAGGDVDKALAEGLVEISWYLPSGKSNDTFHDATAFINLHGDARYHKSQVDFLSKVCFMTFILFNDRDLEEGSTSVIKTLSDTPGGVVLLMCEEVSATAKFQQLRGSIPQGKLEGYRLMKKNVDTVRRDIRQRITKKLEEKWSTVIMKPTLEKSKDLISKSEIRLKVDESRPELIQGHQLACNLRDMITKLKAKDQMLPLQGEELWQAWAKMNKEEHRPVNREGMSIEDFMGAKKQGKENIRNQQVAKLRSPTPSLTAEFTKSLSQSNEAVRNYFLQSFKHFLNNLSRQNTSQFQVQYKKKREELVDYEQKGDANSAKKCRDEINDLQKDMVKSSLGLEHFLREMSQIYEATCYPPQNLDSNLPLLAAELFTKGYPLELMDGDAAHVPEKWIQGVMSESVRILKDPKVFVMSVLGLQSTGKSTLMNTAFGLQFNVSAGRCTRGAFMQLIPLSEDLKEQSECDYLLVVDTEGLRAPELDSQQTQQHDNELATFVVGLANVTMINIYGEVPGDMDDILQTTVHAFLRMKTVLDKLNPSCQFIHQNVSAVTAGDRGEMGRQRFKDKLDKMTQAAAKEEECENRFKSFSDVIMFNPKKDVHHFPGLWNGVPPMAAVNEGYSCKALQLKSHVVEMLKSSKQQRLRPERLSTIATRIDNLWEALLNENFIFSFKNTMEVAVYNGLDGQFIKWTRDLKSSMFKWQDGKVAEIGLLKDKGTAEIQAKESKLKVNDLPAYINKIFGEVEEKMTEFFDKSEDQLILVQWKEETRSRLRRLKEKLQLKAEEHLSEVITQLLAQNKVNDKRTIYCDMVAGRVKTLVGKLDKEEIKRKATNKTEEDRYIKEKFEENWKDWIKEIKKDIKVDTSVQKIDVIHLVHDALVDHFRNEYYRIYKMLGERPLRNRGKSLEGELVPCSEHFNFKRGWLASMKDKRRGPPSPTDPQKRQAMSTAFKAVRAVDHLLCSEAMKNKGFHPQFVSQLLQEVEDVISKDCPKEAEFTYTRNFKVDVSVYVCGSALRTFERWAEEFRQKHNPIHFLETDVKRDLFKNFTDQYHHTADEKVAASAVCEVLSDAVLLKVKRSLPTAIYDDVKKGEIPHLKSKPALKRQIMLDLATQLRGQFNPNLDAYFHYINDPKNSLREWIKHYTLEHAENCSRLQTIAKKELKTELDKLEDKINKIPRSNSAHAWLIYLKSACLLDVDEIKFANKGGRKTLNDFENFLVEVNKGVNGLKTSLESVIGRVTVEEIDRQYTLPYNRFYEELLGCCEQCPFCKEQCDFSDDKHTNDHECRVHRPQCLGSYRNSATQEMVMNICNLSVLQSSDWTFQNDDTKWETMYYRDYRRLYSRWNIQAKTGAEVCGYWRWFVGKYYKEIARKINAKANDVPRAWKEWQWKDAERSLKTDFGDI